MMTIEKLLLAIVAGLAAANLSANQQAEIMKPLQELGGGFSLFVDGVIVDASEVREAWQPPESAKQYLYRLHRSEDRYGIPRNLLVRVAYQESRFRQDIITGKIESSAGAVGIMQIVPRWHPDVNPLDVDEAIDYAGKYLAELKSTTGTWVGALAAYNWGIGNVTRKGIESAPKETRDYIGQIAGDVLGGYA